MVNTGTAVSGLAPTVTGTVTGYSVAPALPAGLSVDPGSGTISGTPTVGTPEAIYTVTASNSAGSAKFPLDLTVADGPVFEVKDAGGVHPPVLMLSDMSPVSGEMLTVTVNVANATSIALSVTGSGCGGLTAQTVNGPSLQQAAAVANSGKCALTAAVTAGGQTVSETNEFTVVPTNLPALASGLTFTGGSYFPSGDASFLPPSSALTIQAATTTQKFVNGGTGSIFVTPSDPTNVSKAVVMVNGIPGYFVVPVVPVGNGQVRIDLAVSSSFFTQLQQSGSSQIRVAPRAGHVGASPRAKAVPKSGIGNRSAANDATPTADETFVLELIDLFGGATPPFSVPLTFQQVGAGSIQVSLSWGQPLDLDLHVVTPAGEEIYYGNRSDSTGGSLDLDSNAGCSIDNVDNENVVWGPSTTPAAGQYIVRVDDYAGCGIDGAVPYTIQVNNCGTTTTYSGTFSSGTGSADGGSVGAGVTVTTFAYTPCAGLSVQGHAMYEDFVPTVTGLSTDPRLLPIRHAVVEVHKQSDDSLLEAGETDETGMYSIPFTMTTPGQYYTEVVAEQNSDTLREIVVNNMGKLYSAKGPTQDASMQPNATNVDIKVTRANNSGAFNLFNVGLNAFNLVRAQTQTTLPLLTWRWTPGVATCGGSASCYKRQDNSIYVLSSATDEDVFDDTVVAHEFGHFFMHNMSNENSPGGAHSSRNRVVPLLAWSEGAATYFGQSVVNSPVYIDTSTGGAFVRHIETPDDDVPTDTSDGTLSGNISEAYVSATLWDLADSGQDTRNIGNNVTVKDVISNQQGVFSSLTALKTTTHDRGVTGPDLVDFLDQWLCGKLSTWDAMPGNNFNGLITGLNQFPFTPQQPAVCN